MKPTIRLCLALVLSGNCDAAIVYPKAPDGGRQMVYEFSSNVLRHDPRFLEGFGVEELTIADPYRVYQVGLTNLASGHLLSAATSRGSWWKYPFLHGTNAIGEAELTADEKTGKSLKVLELSHTPHSQGTLEALRMAERLPQVNKKDYEVRRLVITPISFVAVWLHGESDDLIIPLPRTFDRWNAYQPYSETEMIKLLQEAANKKLRAPPVPD